MQVQDVDAGLTIAAVERDTGISKDTLRVWERRYGFPVPGRNPFGERTYPSNQVAKLRVVKRLLDAGFRPGRVVGMALDELMQLAGPDSDRAAGSASRGAVKSAPDTRMFLDLLRAHDVEGLRRKFDLALMHMGLSRFVNEVITPLNTQIGEHWIRGQIEVFEEHVYTDLVQTMLRHALHDLAARAQPGRPRVLLTTLRDEPHGLGLLMAEVALVVEGAQCVSLGVQTPVPDIVRASMALDSDIVALGFTACNGPNAMLNGLADLRAQLAPQVELWAGGTVAAIGRRVVDGVRLVPELGQIAAELQLWRARRL
jgi:MerR family transcriptional regulator, light-induced transcriptional regulator